MHNGETIQKLAAAVDKIHERHSRNAVKTIFTITPRPWNSEQDTTRHLGAGLIQISTYQRDQRMTLGIPQIE
jgi:hypothetical protein